MGLECQVYSRQTTTYQWGDVTVGSKLGKFLKRKNIELSIERYLVDALGAMALGLFGTLIVGVILDTIGQFSGLTILSDYGAFAKQMVGPGIAVAVAFGLKAPPLVLFASTVAGFAGAQLGGPVGAWVAAVIGTELGKAISRETKLDIVLTPAVVIVSGVTAAEFVGPPIAAGMSSLGAFIMWATELQPLPMGAILAVSMGWILTLPISSAALAIALQLTGLAGGAALAGCAAHMIGFAVASYRDNGFGGLVAQGLGTSMLQIPNIIKKPIIGLPATLAALIGGPLATMVFRMDTAFWGAGMGTSGLVGQFGTITAMGTAPRVWLGMALLHFILPAAVAWATAEFLRARGLIRDGDMKLDL